MFLFGCRSTDWQLFVQAFGKVGCGACSVPFKCCAFGLCICSLVAHYISVASDPLDHDVFTGGFVLSEDFAWNSPEAEA